MSNDKLIADLNTTGSAKLFDAACRVIPGGVNSTARATWAGWTPYPLFVQEGQGSRLRDVDGNEYIDYALAWGPLILGHCHPVVVKAMEECARKPHTYGAQHELEFLVSEKIQKMCPGAEQVAFTIQR